MTPKQRLYFTDIETSQIICIGNLLLLTLIIYLCVGHPDSSSPLPAGIYLLKVNNRNIRTRCEICSKLTMKSPGVFIVNFEHISHLALVFLLLTLNM